MEAWLMSIPDHMVIVLFAIAAIIAGHAVTVTLRGRRVFDPPDDGRPELLALLNGLHGSATAFFVAGVALAAALDSIMIFWAVTIICVEALHLSAMAMVLIRATFDRDTEWRDWIARPMHGVRSSGRAK